MTLNYFFLIVHVVKVIMRINYFIVCMLSSIDQEAPSIVREPFGLHFKAELQCVAVTIFAICFWCQRSYGLNLLREVSKKMVAQLFYFFKEIVCSLSFGPSWCLSIWLRKSSRTKTLWSLFIKNDSLNLEVSNGRDFRHPQFEVYRPIVIRISFYRCAIPFI